VRSVKLWFLVGACWLGTIAPSVAQTVVTATYAYPLVFEWTPPTEPGLEGAIRTTFTGNAPLDLLAPDSTLFRLSDDTWRTYICWDAVLPRLVTFRGGFGDTVTVAASPVPVTPYDPSAHAVPSFHLQTAPANLWDPATGIYCWGDSVNFEQRGAAWQRPAVLTVRDAAGGVLLGNEPVGIRIHGGTSRSLAQKGLRLYFDGYGDSDEVVLDLLGGTLDRFGRLILRTARYPEFCLRDNLANSLFLDLGHDGSRSRFVAVFLNGEYWGGYNLRERFDAKWAETTRDLPAGGYALVKDSRTVAGDGADWFALLRWASRPADYADPAWYAALSSRLDLDSWLDWLLVNIALASADNGYLNNEAQLRVGDGPWRMLMWDEDDVMLTDNVDADLLRFYSSANADQFAAARPPVWYMGGWTEQAQQRCDLLRHALQNQTFRDRFARRWNELTAGPLSVAALQARLDSLVQAQTPELSLHGARWGWTADWYTDTADEISGFLAQRLPVVQAQVTRFLAEFSEPVALSDLTAVQQGDTVVVDWRTEHEQDLAGFILQRSSGTPDHFQEIASYRELPDLRGHNTDRPAGYQYRDPVPAGTDVVFYRLVHEDQKGERTIHVWYATVPLLPVPELVVNELLASNHTVNADEFGEYDDWVELYNTGGDTVSLAGLYLSDDPPALPLRWSLPPAVLPPGGHLLVWCDDDPQQGPLHAPFKLSAAGEAAVLTMADGRTVDEITFGPQQADVSYGRVGDGGPQWTLFAHPTPGAPNAAPTAVQDLERALLAPPRPDPAREDVWFSFRLPAGARQARLDVYDLRGRLVRRIWSGATDGSLRVRWDRRDGRGLRAPAGSYLCRLVVDGAVRGKGKVLLLP